MLKRFATIFVCAFAGLLYSQPVINTGGVLHAGSYGREIAQGSMFVIFGSGLGPDDLRQSSGYPLPRALAGTTVTVIAGTQSLQAPLVYASAGQVGAILPSSTPLGSASVTVTYSGQTSAAAEMRVVRSSFGAFTANARGTGIAVAQNFVSQAEQPRNSLSASAKPGQVVTLWGTGLGAITTDDAAAPTPGPIGSPVEVLVAGRSAKVLYSGRSGCCAGVDQIVFETPHGAETCYAPIEVRVPGVSSTQNATLAVAADGGVCTEPDLLRSEDLMSARQKGSLKIGSLLLVRYNIGEQQSFDYGFISFSKASYQQLAQASQKIAAAAPGACEAASYDMNSMTQTGDLSQIGADFFTNYLFWGGDAPLDAGERIDVSGAGKSVSFARMAPGMYSNFAYDPANPTGFGSFLAPGSYAISNGSGGSDVPGFQASVTVPPTTRFSATQVAIPRSRDYTVRWTGGAQDERVLVTGWSYSIKQMSFGAFTCVQRVNAGSFTIPSSILSMMPATDSMSDGFGYLAMYSFSPFQRSTIGGLDAFYAGVMNMAYQTAQFQ